MEQQVEQGFPFLPAGCHMELDRVASERVLRNIKESVPSLWREKAAELATLAAERPGISLGEFLDASGLELEDVYDSQGRSWTDLREAAGLVRASSAGAHERSLRKACGRMLHVDDPERLDVWRAWLREESVPDVESLTVRERRLLAMLLAQMLSQVASSKSKKKMSVAEGARVLWAHASVRQELVETFDVLAERIAHVTTPLSALPDVPLDVHARYTRLEILAATSDAEDVRMPSWREGVRWVEELPADLFVFTLDKTSGQFSPTTRYRDYAISRGLLHWESQSMTTAESPTGRRYRSHVALGSHVLLFARLSAEDRAFHFLGPAAYVSHVGERPMAVTWRLEHPLPGDLFQAFAAAVA